MYIYHFIYVLFRLNMEVDRMGSARKPASHLYPVAPPFDIAYRNGKVSSPARPHTHNAAEIYYTLTDLPDVLLNDTVSAAPAGTLLVIPAFCIHQLYHETGIAYERYVLSVNAGWLKNVFGESIPEFSYLLDSSAPVLLIPDSQQKSRLICCMNELLSYSRPASPEAMASFFRLFSVIHNAAATSAPLFQKELPISSSQQKVNDIIAFLHEHLDENIRVSDLAAHFFLNPDYLARLFKSHMHISIGQYVTLQKIGTAEALLREGKSVAEVQEALGYSSYAYFFKTFQKATGISPSRYRRQYH